ncbi:MAG TPA: type IV pilus biogenesis/stability protein PilW [Burkholderiaceae bacterium]|nr:type IV pilus biogenesis/stability protein PilW [Burkholderiaceae bacterium]
MTLARMAGALLAGVLVACTTTTVTTSSGEVVAKGPERVVANAGAADARTRARARADLAAGYYRSGQLAVALDEARRAAAIDPGYAETYGLLGLIYMDMNERGEAEESFQKALRLDPAGSELANNYGWFLCQTGRERDSIQYFDRALRDPLYTTPARAGQNAGSCLFKLKDYASAERYLRRSFELDASNAGTKYLLSRTYLMTGQIDRATFYYNLLARSVESTPETLWLGLRIARANGDVRTETQLANELRERFPRSPEVSALARGDFND